ncbi:hypothetical protein GCM10027512_19900 [Chromohalobacter beijerinckii]
MPWRIPLPSDDADPLKGATIPTLTSAMAGVASNASDTTLISDATFTNDATLTNDATRTGDPRPASHLP